MPKNKNSFGWTFCYGCLLSLTACPVETVVSTREGTTKDILIYFQDGQGPHDSLEMA